MQLANLIGQVLDEKYQIERQLGEGGMGAVYLAMHLGTGRPVALKLIAPQFMMNDEFVERFRREAKAAGRLRHPNVVDVTDFGFARVDQERVAYLVMEYLDGCSLAEILKEEKRLPIEWVLDIAEQTCSAVDEAHQQGVIHRDLKPDNIWLEPNRRGGYTVKVLDFGLAKLGEAPTAPLPDPQPPATSPVTRLPVSRTDPRAESIRTTVGESQTQVFEASTRIQPPPEASASASHASGNQTQIDTAFSGGDGATRVMSSVPAAQSDSQETRIVASEQEATRVSGPDTFGRLAGGATMSDDGLTRVGSIMGTPTYMSPEQCRGEALTAQSDIYSLGVIAYQMLTGQTPFAGSIDEVMRAQISEGPQPLRQRGIKIRKRTEKWILSALAKDPGQRPVSAAAFASALRGNTEGFTTLARRTLALFSEYAPTFLRVAIVINLPFVLLTAIRIGQQMMYPISSAKPSVSLFTAIALNLVALPVSFVTVAAQSGIIVLVVTQILAAPLRPLDLKLAISTLKKRWKPLVKTQLLVMAIALGGFVLALIPGIIFALGFSLTYAAVIIEGLSGRAALRRSWGLVKRDRPSVLWTGFISFIIPVIASALISVFIGLLSKQLKLPDAPRLTANLTGLIWLPLQVFVIAIMSVLSSLLYLKTRQAGGETLKQALAQFEENVPPRTNWQLRMRERLHFTSHPSR